MKSIKIAAAFLLLCVLTSPAQVLVSLGSNGFSVDEGSSAPYSQTAITLAFNSSVAFGDTVYGAWNTTYNWSSYINFGLEFNVVGTNPNLPVSVYFYDTNFNLINEYSLSTAGVGSTTTVVPLVLVTPGSGNLNAVANFQLSWAGNGAVNATFTNVVAIPEPSTWILLSGALAAMAFCRRKNSTKYR